MKNTYLTWLFLSIVIFKLSFSKELKIISNYPVPHNNLDEVYRETKNIYLIKEILENSGDFNKVEVLSEDTIRLDRKLILKAVYIKGNFSIWKNDILSSAGLVENSIISLDDIFNIPLRIKNLYMDRGFPFVKVNVKDKIDNKNGFVYLWIDIDENFQYEIEKIKINSDRPLTKDLKKKLIEVSKLYEETFSLSKVDDGIDYMERYLRSLGYFDAVVSLIKFKKMRVYPKPFSVILKNPLEIQFFVETGDRYIFKFKGVSKDEEKIFLKKLSIFRDGFSKVYLNDLKEYIEKFYINKNYLDTDVKYKVKDKLNNLVLITFKIDKGKKYKIKSLTINTDDKYLKTKLKSLDKKNLTIGKIKKILESYTEKIKKEGFINSSYNLKIDKHRGSFSVLVKFNRGKKYILKNVVIKNIPNFKVKLDLPQIYNYQFLETLHYRLKEYIKEKGYFEGDVLLETISEVNDDKVYITAVYTGELGKRYGRYKSVVYGTFHLLPKYIVRNLDEDYNYYSQEKEDSNINYLYQTYIFNSVYLNKFLDKKNKKVLETYYLREAKRGLFQFSVGYNTENELKFTGLLTLRNLFNYGLEINGYINFSSKRVLSQVSLGSRVLPYKITAFLNFYKDYQYHRFFDKDIEGYGVYAYRFVNKWVKRGIYLERNYIQVKNTDLNLGRYQRYFITKLKYKIIDDHRNSNFFPTEGYYFTGSLTKYFEDLTYFRLDGYFRYYYNILKNLVWTHGFNTGYIWEKIKNIPISERYFIGKNEGLRGFGYEEIKGDNYIGGKSFLVINNELRFPIYGGVYGFVFIDIGNVFGTDKEFRKFETRETGGIGFMIPTPAGAINFDIAKKLDKKRNENKYRIELSVNLRF